MTNKRQKKKSEAKAGPGFLNSRPIIGHIGNPGGDSRGSNALATMSLLGAFLPAATKSSECPDAQGGDTGEGDLDGNEIVGRPCEHDDLKDYMFKVLPLEILQQILDILYSEHEVDVSTTRILDSHASPPSRFNYPMRALRNLSATSRTARQIVSPYVFRFVKLQTNQAGLVTFFNKISFLICSPLVRRHLRHVQVYNVCTRSEVCRSANRHLGHKEFLSATRFFWQMYRKQLTHLSFYLFCGYHSGRHTGYGFRGLELCGFQLFEFILDEYDFPSIESMGGFESYQNYTTEGERDYYKWYEPVDESGRGYRCNFQEFQDDSTFWQNMRRLKVGEEGSNTCQIMGKRRIRDRSAGQSYLIVERFRFDPVSLETRMALKAAGEQKYRYGASLFQCEVDQHVFSYYY